jgi:hypothetical protein
VAAPASPSEGEEEEEVDEETAALYAEVQRKKNAAISAHRCVGGAVEERAAPLLV